MADPTPKHYGDHQPETIYAPQRYASDLHGRGRWVILQAPLGMPAVRLFTDDHDRLGYMQVGLHDQAADLCATLNAALRGAKAVGATTSDVFDYWATRASQSVWAGEIEAGDLELLTPTPPNGA